MPSSGKSDTPTVRDSETGLASFEVLGGIAGLLPFNIAQRLVESRSDLMKVKIFNRTLFRATLGQGRSYRLLARQIDCGFNVFQISIYA